MLFLLVDASQPETSIEDGKEESSGEESMGVSTKDDVKKEIIKPMKNACANLCTRKPLYTCAHVPVTSTHAQTPEHARLYTRAHIPVSSASDDGKGEA